MFVCHDESKRKTKKNNKVNNPSAALRYYLGPWKMGYLWFDRNQIVDIILLSLQTYHSSGITQNHS